MENNSNNSELWKSVEEAIKAGETEAEDFFRDNLTKLVEPLQNFARELLSMTPSGILQNVRENQQIATRRRQLLDQLDKTFSPTKVKEVIETYNEQIGQAKDLALYTQKKVEFWHQLNLFLGQQVKTIYVYKGEGADVVLAEISSETALGKKTGGYTRHYTEKRSVMDAINEAREKSEENKDKANNLNVTYTEVYERANSFKNKSNQAKKKQSTLIVLWEYQRQWIKMRVSNFGDINEAYAAFYLNHKFDLFNSILEDDINTFMTKEHYGVAAVDSVSGILQGDVNIGKIAYSIKSSSASIFGDSDILNIAAALCSIKATDITQDILRTMQGNLANMGSTRNKILEQCDGEINQILDSIQKEIEEKR